MIQAVNRELDTVLPRVGDLTVPAELARAMRYSAERGKRVRPCLTIASGLALGAQMESLAPFACAIELIHTYSLIHDDLPALDDDLVRRGSPTCHKLFGEGMALLAGDALLAQAFVILAREGRRVGRLSPQVLLEIVEEVAEAAGVHGLVAGQVMDLESEGKELTEQDLQDLHQHKTGSLILLSVRIGGRVAGADATEMDCLTRYGRALGLAFQIADDVLDVVGGVEQTGKMRGRDARKGKATFASFLGVEVAIEAVSHWHARAELLRKIARSVGESVREKGHNPWEGF
jgi:geranylgeranyl diphosphate synthase type II